MVRIFRQIWNTFKDNALGGYSREMQVQNYVRAALKEHKDTINFLDKYDKGEVSTPATVAKHRDLQSYLQSL